MRVFLDTWQGTREQLKIFLQQLFQMSSTRTLELTINNTKYLISADQPLDSILDSIMVK